jgi:phosphatidylserine/phosphatidylglycerophosphate/cardiolipin synthase-like enzyme
MPSPHQPSDRTPDRLKPRIYSHFQASPPPSSPAEVQFRKLWKYGASGLLGLLLLAGVLKSCQTPRSVATLPPLPQDPNIQVYFNQAEDEAYTEPYRKVRRSGHNLEALLLKAIQEATQTIDVAVQELRVPQVAQALAQKQQQGIRVRVILENNYRQPISRMDSSGLSDRDRLRYQDNVKLVDQDQDNQMSEPEIRERDAIAILEQANIPILDDTADGSKGSGLMHHKFVIVDNHVVVTGSANFTLSDLHGDLSTLASRGNPNHLLQIRNTDVAQQFSNEFALMWGDGPGGKPDSQFGLKLTKFQRAPKSTPAQPRETIALRQREQLSDPILVGASTLQIHFSPTPPKALHSGTHLITSTLETANQQVDLALFVFSEQAIANALLARHRQSVAIRALISSEFAFRPYSEALDMLGVSAVGKACKAEPGNQPWSPPLTTVGVPQLPPGDLLHHKFAVIDRAMVITGSFNWSRAADQQNNETLLVIENPVVAAHFQREFDRLYKGAALGIPAKVREKLQVGAVQCPGGGQKVGQKGYNDR